MFLLMVWDIELLLKRINGLAMSLWATVVLVFWVLKGVISINIGFFQEISCKCRKNV